MKLIFIFVLCICNTISVSAQDSVQDSVLRLEIVGDNKPLVGATVFLLKEKIACVTDNNGIAVIKHNAKIDEVLRVSFIGYSTFTKKISSKDYYLKVKLKKDNKLLHELVVMSDKQKRIKKEESLSVDLVNTAFLNKNNTGSLMTSLNSIAGISSIDIGSGQSKPVIRGLGFNRLGVSENGVKHEGQQWGSDHGLEIDMYAIDNIEIIKGPSSLMYGSDAIAGMVRINTKQKPHSAGFGADLFSSFRTNNMSYTNSLNLHLLKKNFYFNSQFTYIDYADYKLPTDSLSVYSFRIPLHNNRLRNTAGNNKSAYLCFAYFNDNVESKFIFSNYNSKSGFFANAHGLEPRNVNEALYDKSSRDINQASQYVNHFKISNQTVITQEKSSAVIDFSYQKNLRKEFSKYTSHGFMPSVLSSDFSGKENVERHFNKDIFTAKAKYNFSYLNHEIVLGVSSQYQDNNIDGWSFIIPKFKQYKLGAFIYDKIEFKDDWFLHFGLRFDRAKLDISSYYDWFKSKIQNNEESKNLQRVKAIERNFNNITAAIGVNVNYDNLFLKLNIAKSYRLPTAKELAANGVNYHYFSYEKGNPRLDPEQAYQLDIGIDYLLYKFNVNFTPFVSYFPNYIFLNPTSKRDYSYGAGNQVYDYVQTRLLRYGGEVKLCYNISESIKLISASEYVYSEQLSGSKKGFSLPFSPPASTSVNLDYNFRRKGRFVNSFMNLGVKICAAQNRIVPPERKTKGYNLVSFSCGTKYYINKSYLDFNIKVNNLLNTKYFNHMSFYRLIDVPEAGRDLVFSLKIPFNIFN